MNQFKLEQIKRCVLKTKIGDKLSLSVSPLSLLSFEYGLTELFLVINKSNTGFPIISFPAIKGNLTIEDMYLSYLNKIIKRPKKNLV